AGRQAISKDISKLIDQLDNIASQTNYNGISLLQASATGTGTASSQTFQMGDKAANTISSGDSVQANSVGLSLNGLDGMTSAAAVSLGGISAANARLQMVEIDQALDKLNGWRADFGSTQNQLESAVRNLSTQQTNIKNAESIIRDVDYAKESANFSKQNIIAQAGTYALSQANNMQQNVTRLLQ
ncbi:MAG: flagellin, partial [Poseidonibacter sp.]|uniref:flagellin n=1 Tax=Poseidonibacter sp. TaxID=2321188 RepID=UPI00359EC351